MLEPLGPLLIHMSPALLMGTLLLVNLLTRKQREAGRQALESQRMAVALEVELRSLLDSYNENLDLIAAGSPFLVSTRSAGAMYRGNLGRALGALDAPALGAVVAAFAHQQRLEAYLGACTKPNGPHGVTILPRLTKLQELKVRYAEGCREVERALAALGPSEGKQAMGLRPMPRQRQAFGIQM